jgi:hypothetical protein
MKRSLILQGHAVEKHAYSIPVKKLHDKRDQCYERRIIL